VISSAKTGLFACRRGASAVEMALVLPLFLGLLFGIVKIGRAHV